MKTKIKEVILITLVIVPVLLVALYGFNKSANNWCDHAREAGYDFTQTMKENCK